MSNNFKISLVVFMPNITTNHAITYTKKYEKKNKKDSGHCSKMMPSCKWPTGNPQSEMQNPRLSWIILHEARWGGGDCHIWAI